MNKVSQWMAGNRDDPRALWVRFSSFFGGLPGISLCLLLSACGDPASPGRATEPVSVLDRWSVRFDTSGRAQSEPLPGSRDAEGRWRSLRPDALTTAFAAVAGESLEVLPVRNDAGQAVALVLKASLLRFEAQLVGGDEGTTGIAALGGAGVVAVLGSPFVAEFSPLRPLGLLKIDGREQGPLQPYGYTRVLGFTDNGIGVVDRSGYQRDLFPSALQAGPGIVESGVLDISERELRLPAYFRTFVARCDSALLLGATLQPIHLRLLGADLLNFADRQGLRCDEVVNLSGDREALLGARKGRDATVLGNPRARKTALIVLRTRTAESGS